MMYVVESGQVELASVAPRRTCCRGSPGLKTGTMCTHLSSPGASSGNKRACGSVFQGRCSPPRMNHGRRATSDSSS